MQINAQLPREAKRSQIQDAFLPYAPNQRIILAMQKNAHLFKNQIHTPSMRHLMRKKSTTTLTVQQNPSLSKTKAMSY